MRQTSTPLRVSLLLSLLAAVPAGPSAGLADDPSDLAVERRSVPEVDFGVVAPPPREVVERLNLSPFYEKHLVVGGLSIVASGQVPDAALAEAAWLVQQMLGRRADILQALVRNRVRVAVMAHTELTTDIPEHSDLRPRDYWDRRARGLGASRRRPAVSCGAENLLRFPGDPYAAENIFIHEFGHAIHEMGLRDVDPTFDARLKVVYEQSLEAGLWRDTYAASNKEEFWAEGVQSWFDANREHDREHNHVNTRAELKEYDPALARLLEEVFGDGPWRYTRPETRRHLPHLAQWDPAQNPRFRWPPDVSERYRAFQRAAAGEPLGGDAAGWREIALSPPDRLEELRSPGSAAAAVLLFVNRRAAPVRIEWIGFDGRLRPMGEVPPGRHRQIETFQSHLFVLSSGEGRLGVVAAEGERGRVLLADSAEQE